MIRTETFAVIAEAASLKHLETLLHWLEVVGGKDMLNTEQQATTCKRQYRSLPLFTWYRLQCSGEVEEFMSPVCIEIGSSEATAEGGLSPQGSGTVIGSCDTRSQFLRNINRPCDKVPMPTALRKVVTLKRRCDGFGKACEDSFVRAYLKPRFNIHYAQEEKAVCHWKIREMRR